MQVTIHIPFQLIWYFVQIAYVYSLCDTMHHINESWRLSQRYITLISNKYASIPKSFAKLLNKIFYQKYIPIIF